MSTDGNTDRPRRHLSRREFLVLGGTGASVLAFGGYASRIAAGQQAGERFSYRGRTVSVTLRNGRPQLSIDGEPVVVVDTNGTYRAAGFAFDWASTPGGLAKNIIDCRVALASGR
jgi:hypothetical protein